MTSVHEPVIVFEKDVMCDGPTDNPALGHPRIYLHIQEDHIECPYCGKSFVYTNNK